jgi:hypothetical protein
MIAAARDQHVGRGPRALARQALDQLVVFRLDHVHLDPGATGEGLPDGAIAAVVAGAVDVHLRRLRRQDGSEQGGGNDEKANHGRNLVKNETQ